MAKMAIDVCVKWKACSDVKNFVAKCATETTTAAVAIDRMGFLLKRGIWVEKIEWTEGNEISSVESI